VSAAASRGGGPGSQGPLDSGEDARRPQSTPRRPQGAVVVLDFWASWCAPCRTTFPKLDALARELKDQGVDVLAVSVDEKRKDLDAFLDEHSAALDVLLDPHADAAAKFGVTAIPSMYVIDRDGMIRFSHPNYAVDVLDGVRAEIASLTTTSPGNPSPAPRD